MDHNYQTHWNRNWNRNWRWCQEGHVASRYLRQQHQHFWEQNQDSHSVINPRTMAVKQWDPRSMEPRKWKAMAASSQREKAMAASSQREKAMAAESQGEKAIAAESQAKVAEMTSPILTCPGMESQGDPDYGIQSRLGQGMANHGTLGPTQDTSLSVEACCPLSPHWLGDPKGPYFQRVQDHINWWEKHAPQNVVNLITHGVSANWPLPEFVESPPHIRSQVEVNQALKVLEEYIQVGAVVKNPPGTTRHLVPWFVISKEENGKEKLRLIANCKTINNYFAPKHFKLDHWGNIFPFLKKGMWGAK